jgi:hypothetical protein
MNERIRELLEQATIIEVLSGRGFDETQYTERFNKEKFAKLIVVECKENFAKVWYEQGLDIRGAELDKFMKRFNEHFGVEE